jgi:hypothetical protein
VAADRVTVSDPLADADRMTPDNAPPEGGVSDTARSGSPNGSARRFTTSDVLDVRVKE